jgi:hypothetical protein
MSEDPSERLWAVELTPIDRAVLEEAFLRDRELRRDVGLALIALAELGVQEAFVQALVRRLRRLGLRAPPALAVLPAAEDALQEVVWPY